MPRRALIRLSRCGPLVKLYGRAFVKVNRVSRGARNFVRWRTKSRRSHLLPKATSSLPSLSILFRRQQESAESFPKKLCARDSWMSSKFLDDWRWFQLMAHRFQFICCRSSKELWLRSQRKSSRKTNLTIRNSISASWTLTIFLIVQGKLLSRNNHRNLITIINFFLPKSDIGWIAGTWCKRSDTWTFCKVLHAKSPASGLTRLAFSSRRNKPSMFYLVMQMVMDRDIYKRSSRAKLSPLKLNE